MTREEGNRNEDLQEVREVYRKIRPKYKCRWVVRPGTCNTFWAYTACTEYKDYCYLSKVSNRDYVKSVYEGRICPKCNEKIEIDVDLLYSEIFDEEL